MQRRIWILLVAVFALPLCLKAQKNPVTGQELGKMYNTISTAVPFVAMAPDARSAGMGDIGVATPADLNSQHYNAAKYPFMKDDFGFSLTYSPWLVNLVNDMSLAYLSGAYKFKDDRSAIAFSLLYFSMGDVTFTTEYDQVGNTYKPNEFSIDLSSTFGESNGEYVNVPAAEADSLPMLTVKTRLAF